MVLRMSIVVVRFERLRKLGESALQSRIDAGLADPISDRERELVKEMSEDFEKKWGRKPGTKEN